MHKTQTSTQRYNKRLDDRKAVEELIEFIPMIGDLDDVRTAQHALEELAPSLSKEEYNKLHTDIFDQLQDIEEMA